MITLKPVVIAVLGLVFVSAASGQQTNRPRQTQLQQGSQATVPQQATGKSRLPQSRRPTSAGQRTTPSRQATRPRANPQAAPAATPRIRLPEGFPLPDKDQKRVDDILRFWENNTAKIKTFKCQFRKWDYDAVFGVKHNGKLLPKSQSDGILRYAKPDKGLFHVMQVRDLVPPKLPKDKPTFKKRENELGEKWVCDGNTIYEFDSRRKQIVETVLPPNMRGQGITNGPLPFMFGAKAADLRQRYWIREMKPSEGVKQIWLDAYPKRREDAANFSRVIFFLDHQEFLPAALRMYDPNGKSYTAYSFSKRKKNDPVDTVSRMFNPYIPKSTPKGWQRIQRNLGATEAPQQTAKRNPRQSTQRGVRTASGTRKTSPR